MTRISTESFHVVIIIDNNLGAILIFLHPLGSRHEWVWASSNDLESELADSFFASDDSYAAPYLLLETSGSAKCDSCPSASAYTI